MTPYEPTSGYIPFLGNLNHWFKGTQSTPDLRITSHALYTDCSQQNEGCDKARTGTRAVGLMTWLKNGYMDDYREYLQVRLKNPLSPNKETHISFWVCKERNSKLVSDNMGVYFTEKKIFKDTEGPLHITPHLNCDTLINEKIQQWVEMKWSFFPDKAFQYVTIGNLFGNEKTDTMAFKNYTGIKYNPTYAYYLIDDVRIWQDTIPGNEYVFEEKIIEPNQPFELPNILFQFDKAVLDTVSFFVLNKLATFLKEQSSLDLIIHGHTDSKGDNEYNLTLSEKRAGAVYLFLIVKGVEPERMSFMGFGEEKPISESDEENRRVEFIVTQK